MKNKYLCLLFLLFSLVSMSAHAQIKVEGNVFDENDTPLIGVSVVAEGGTNGAITDLNGHFSLMVSNANSHLTFSYVGYITQKVQLKGKKLLKIILREDANLLDEVVVVGYGTQKKINVTGAIAQVDNKELKMAPSGSLSGMLAGRLPGLISKQSSGQPGADGANLYIRGNGAGDGSPLIVIDGVITDYFPSFSPDEVESITILKDATAAAVYGVRAAAGVILITTKRGAVQKPTVTYNGSLTLSQNTDFPKFLNGPDYAYWYNKAQLLDGVAEENLRFSPEEIDRITNPGENEHIYGNTDWFDLLFRNTAPTYTNNVSVSGGTEKIKFFASVGAYNQEGIIKRTSYDKYNFRSNMDAKITDNFDLSLDLSGYVSEQDEPGASAGVGSYASIFQQALLSYPYLKPYTADGMPIASINTAGNGNNNPIAARDLSGNNNVKKTYFQGNIAMKYQLPFVKGLSVKLNASYLKNYTMQKKYFLTYDVYGWNQTTRQGNVETGRIANKVSLNQWFTESEGYTIQPALEYSNKFGKHAISGLFLYEFSRTDESSMSAGRTDFPITDIMDLNYGLEVNKDLVKGGHSQAKRAGYVIRLNYSYDDKYLLEFTSRIDASTALPKKYRWGVFPGVSVGWRLSQEDFFKEAVPFMENLKIRASVGRLGSDRAISNTMTYFSTATLSADPTVLFGTSPQKYLGLSSPVNPFLKWQLTDTYNVGIESSMWNGLFQSEEEIAHSAVFGPTLPGDIKLKDINGDGKITWDQDMVPIGRSNTPEMMFGLNLGAEWKGFDFNMLLQGAALFDVNLCGLYSSGIRDDTFYTRPFYADGNTPYYLVEGAWRPDHTDAKYPRLGIESRSNGGKFSSWWVEDGSYVRLKSIQLGYTIPKKWSKKAGFERIRAYVAGGNLFTLSHLEHMDPEMPSVNQGYYPQQRTYEFGLNVTF